MGGRLRRRRLRDFRYAMAAEVGVHAEGGQAPTLGIAFALSDILIHLHSPLPPLTCGNSLGYS